VATALRTRVEIEAPAGRVWAILADLDGYPEWNTFTPKIETDRVVGHPIVVHLASRSGTRRQVETLARWAPGEELRWGASIGPPWLFRAERVQRVEPLGEQRCCYVNELVFTGLLALIVRPSVELERGFDRMAADLARRAEPRRERPVRGEFVHRGRHRPGPDAPRLGTLGESNGYDVAITTVQSPTAIEPVDDLDWQPCHACATSIPVEFDCRIVGPQRVVESTGTISYVCPHCWATQIGTEPDPGLFEAQRNCHVCGHDLGDSPTCECCGMLRYWAVVACPRCGSPQAVEAPHLGIHCDAFTLDCVACRSRFVSLCIC